MLAHSETRLIERLREIARSEDSHARAAIAGFARITPVPASIDLLPLLLCDDDQRVVTQSERTLHALADHRHTLRYQQRDALECVALEILRSYPEHHSSESIRAIERLSPWLGPDWKRSFSTSDDAERMLMRTAIRRADDPDAPTRCVAWLAIDELAGAALDALDSIRRPDDIRGALRAAHLLRTHTRSSALRTTRRPLDRLTLDSLDDHDPTSIVARTRFHDATANALPDVVLRQALLHPSTEVRWAVASRCADAMPSQAGALECLRDMAFDPHHAIARSSTIALLTSDSTPHPQMQVLRNSAHPSVRRIARLDTLPARPWQRYASLRHQLAHQPDILLATLRGALESADETHILDTLLTIDRLALAPTLEKPILALLEHDSPRVCASAVRLAARIPTASARASLACASAHPDARVRANTIESIAISTPDAPIIVRATADDVPRLRANAIRAHLRVNRHEATSLLDDMLVDDRPAHRLSALWVARRSSVIPLTQRVAAIASDEPDIRVRACAQRCVNALEARSSAPRRDTPSATV
ncbi:MAG: HEAT repeat domain-containing protein [Phycisphaerales bacterium JB043]